MRLKELLVLVALSMLFAGCAAKNNAETSDFMFYNDDKSVGYGSTIAEVEALFGASFEKTPFSNDYGIAAVIFRDDKAVYVVIEPDSIESISDNLWVTSKGIGIGSKEAELQEAYDLTTADKYKDFAYDIPLKIDGENLIKCSNDKVEYYLVFYLSGGNIYRIAFCDVTAAKIFM